MATDLIVHGSGTIYTLLPVSRRGSRWLAEHSDADAPRLGDSVAVEHRYVLDVVRGAVADGLRVR